MKRLTILGIIACVGLLFAPAMVISQPPGSGHGVNVNPSTYRFIGITEAVYNGDLGGFGGAAEKCRAEFGTDALLSTSAQFINAPTNLPSGSQGLVYAWIQPVIVGTFTYLGEYYVIDVSGFTAPLQFGTGTPTCGQWTSNLSTNVGTIAVSGFNLSGIDTAACNGTFPLACSAPSYATNR